MLPVINYDRLEKLKVDSNDFKIDMNKICLILFIIIVVFIYKRYVDVNKRRQQF